MNEALSNALELTPARISDIQSDISSIVNKQISDSENSRIQYQERRNRRLESVRERQIVLVEELMLLETTFSYSLFKITEPTQQELEVITSKINAMSKSDKTDTITKLNKIIKQLMVMYRLNNSTKGIEGFLGTKLNVSGVI